MQKVLFLLLIAVTSILQLWISSGFFYFRPQGGQFFFPWLKGTTLSSSLIQTLTHSVCQAKTEYSDFGHQQKPQKIIFSRQRLKKTVWEHHLITQLKCIATKTSQMKRYVHITDASKDRCEQRCGDALWMKGAPETHTTAVHESLNCEMHVTWQSPSGLLILTPVLVMPSFHQYSWHL